MKGPAKGPSNLVYEVEASKVSGTPLRNVDLVVYPFSRVEPQHKFQCHACLLLFLRGTNFVLDTIDAFSS
jgi:hypothetical protein